MATPLSLARVSRDVLGRLPAAGGGASAPHPPAPVGAPVGVVLPCARVNPRRHAPGEAGGLLQAHPPYVRATVPEPQGEVVGGDGTTSSRPPGATAAAAAAVGVCVDAQHLVGTEWGSFGAGRPGAAQCVGAFGEPPPLDDNGTRYTRGWVAGPMDGVPHTPLPPAPDMPSQFNPALLVEVVPEFAAIDAIVYMAEYGCDVGFVPPPPPDTPAAAVTAGATPARPEVSSAGSPAAATPSSVAAPGSTSQVAGAPPVLVWDLSTSQGAGVPRVVAPLVFPNGPTARGELAPILREMYAADLANGWVVPMAAPALVAPLHMVDKLVGAAREGKPPTKWYRCVFDGSAGGELSVNAGIRRGFAQGARPGRPVQRFVTVAAVRARMCAMMARGELIFLSKVDVSAAYRRLRLALACIPLAGLRVPGWDGFFAHAACPFGIVTCGMFCQMVTDAVVFAMRKHNGGSWSVNYLDDVLTLSTRLDDALAAVRRLTFTLNAIGLPVNMTKLAEEGSPSPDGTFLGVTFRTVLNEMLLDEAKCEKLAVAFEGVLRRRRVPVRQCQQVAGLATFFCSVYTTATVYAGSWWAACGGHGMVTVTARMRADARRLLRLVRVCRAVPIMLPPPASVAIYTDASLVGFGGFCGPWWFCGVWTRREIKEYAKGDIFVFETFTAVIAIWLFWRQQAVDSAVVALRVDNMGTLGAIRRWRSKKPLANGLVGALVEFMVAEGVADVDVQYVDTVSNATADALSRPDKVCTRLTSPLDPVGFPKLPRFQLACGWRQRRELWRVALDFCSRGAVRRDTGRGSTGTPSDG